MATTDQTRNDKNTTTSINLAHDERTLSLLGGAIMLALALLRPKKFGLLLAPTGIMFFYRGLTGRSLVYTVLGRNTAVHNETASVSVPHQQGVHLSSSITIARPVEDVFAYWRDVTNLPKFMHYLDSVTVKSPTESHWRVNGPAGITIEWDAEIIHEEANTVIGWRSLENPYVDHAGSVRFKPAPADQGTEVHVQLEYAPPGGKAGAALMGFFSELPERQILNDLRRLKQYLEVGDVAPIDGQPSGREQES
jgi:uncharacterized membrane protein